MKLFISLVAGTFAVAICVFGFVQTPYTLNSKYDLDVQVKPIHWDIVKNQQANIKRFDEVIVPDIIAVINSRQFGLTHKSSKPINDYLGELLLSTKKITFASTRNEWNLSDIVFYVRYQDSYYMVIYNTSTVGSHHEDTLKVYPYNYNSNSGNDQEFLYITID